MAEPAHARRVWLRWLQAAVGLAAVMAVVPMLSPAAAGWGMALLVFADPERFGRFLPQAGFYITFVHGVLGAVMLAWAVLLLWVVRGPLAAGLPGAWAAVAASVAAWFVPGTLFSAWLQIWPNVVFNLGFAALFAVPLAGLRRGR